MDTIWKIFKIILTTGLIGLGLFLTLIVGVIIYTDDNSGFQSIANENLVEKSKTPEVIEVKPTPKLNANKKTYGNCVVRTISDGASVECSSWGSYLEQDAYIKLKAKKYGYSELLLFTGVRYNNDSWVKVTMGGYSYTFESCPSIVGLTICSVGDETFNKLLSMLAAGYMAEYRIEASTGKTNLTGSSKAVQDLRQRMAQL